MKKKQSVLTLITLDGKFVAPNRATARKLEATRQRDLLDPSIPDDNKFTYTRLLQTPRANENKAEFRRYRIELAYKHGSLTGRIKKKHLNKERLLNETNV